MAVIDLLYDAATEIFRGKGVGGWLSGGGLRRSKKNEGR